MKFTEGAFRDWGYELATRRISRSRSSPSAKAGFSTTRTTNPNLTVEQNAAMIEPGLEQATEAFQASRSTRK